MLARPSAIGWIALACSLAAGCNAAFGIDELKTADPPAAEGGSGGEGGAGGSVTAGGMGGQPCADGTVCVPASDAATAYAVLVDAAQSCPDALSGRTVSSCDGCSCVDDGGDCNTSVASYLEDTCANVVGTTTASLCVNPSGTSARWFIARATPNDNASCTPSAPTAAPTLLQTCETDAPEPCDTGVCMPEAPDTCIVTTGASCPAPYDVQRIVYLDGTADCACSCSSAPQACEAAAVDVFDLDNNCGGNPTRMVPMNGMCEAAGNTDSFSIPTVSGTVACGASGTIMGAMAQTLCCLP
jgi:hypothetical protein